MGATLGYRAFNDHRWLMRLFKTFVISLVLYVLFPLITILCSFMYTCRSIYFCMPTMNLSMTS
jgi:hypothetical protein